GTVEMDAQTGASHRVSESDVTCVNLTIVNGGVAQNVVPSRIEVVLDCRFPHTFALDDARKLVARWCSEAGGDDDGADSVRTVWHTQVAHIAPEMRCIPDGSAHRAAVERACVAVGYAFEWQSFPAGTDSRFLRAHGVRAIGVSPLVGLPRLLHCHDEY